MAVTMKEVREALDPEEPNYQQAAALGPEALPHVEALVSSGDPMLASKATYLASLIEDARAAEVVKKAARSTDPVVRVAAAAAASNLGSAGASDVLHELASDPDPGVRKVARSPSREPRVPARPESGERSDKRPPSALVMTGRMPGEEDGADSTRSRSTMPGPGARSGEGAGGMPGERQDASRGLMPGEKPGGGGMPR
ncbi:MAG: HEAT repeat domain-containing protein [Gaiellales bacterium]